MRYFAKNIKYELIRGKLRKNNPFNYEYDVNEEKPIIYLFFVACGTNMGDHAIVKAEEEYLSCLLGGDIHIVEVQTGQTENAINVVKKNIRQQDIIILSGGGYIGDEYIEIYNPLLRMMKVFRKNKIIIFPQTIFFHNMRQEKKFIALCKKCTKLQIFVREKKSKAIFLKHGIKTKLVPDIVLSQSPIVHVSTEKNEILMCMRNDVEKGLTNKEFDLIKNILLNFGEVLITDTVVDTIFPMNQRWDYLNRILDQFSKSTLVVTDRIHGMIFSYLTNTPCIAFGNYNHKVESEYEWIKKSSNICFFKSVDEELIKTAVSDLIKNPYSNNKAYCNEFESLKKVIISYYEQ